jgi:glycerol-3-phosphate dehydrogenase
MKTICVSQGIHLVLDKKFFPSSHALMIPETRDGRVLFAIPWYDKIVLGTTDTPVQKASLEPEAMEEEISFILDTASTYLELKPKRSDVLSVFAGLRPLAAPKEGRQKTKEISRSHKILVSPSNLFTIVGGKWTTYRKMGEDMVNRVEEHLMWPSRKTSTTLLPIHGYQWDGNVNDPFSFYGSDALMIRQNMNGKDNAWISKSLKIHEVQLKWAVQNEMARTVEDFLSRRTRALLLDAKESIRICNEVATIMAELLGKDNQWIEIQVADFTSLANKYVLK